MENITNYSTFLKGILDTNPWIWHVIQGFLLFTFYDGFYLFPKPFSKFLKYFDINFSFKLIYLLLFLYNKIELWGLVIYFTLIISDFVIRRLFKETKSIIALWDSLSIIFWGTIVFSFCNELSLKYKILIFIIYLYYSIDFFETSMRIREFENKDNTRKPGYFRYFKLAFIGLVILPIPWLIWIMVIIDLFSTSTEEINPEYDLLNNNILIDNWKENSKNASIFFMIFILVILIHGFNITSYLFFGFLNFIFFFFSQHKKSEPMIDYDSFSFVRGNFNFLKNAVRTKKLSLLVQRISINISDNNTYGILVSPYERVIAGNKNFQNISDLAHSSHHFISLDGGEVSDKIIKIEQDLVQFLGRVDTVIDCFTIANQTIDDYSEPIDLEYATCIRERMAIKQSIIDEKPFELNENPEEKDKTIDTFINSINTESVRINILVREYFKESTLDYSLLQTELENQGPFEINTLLRQMREGGSIPSRFVDALSIAEVAARYLFSVVNEVNIYKDNTENGIQERNVKYSQLSFGPCVGFLRTITEKGKLNDFEKSIKEILKTKYTDNVNCERLKKYLTKDLHYGKEVKDEPTLFDLFNYLAYIRNKTRGHGTPSKVEFEFYVTLDLISIFIVHCISKIQIETYTRQIINDKEWLLFYNAGGNVVLHPLNCMVNLDYWRDSFDWNYIDKMDDAKKHLEAVNQAVYFKIIYRREVVWIRSDTYFKCRDGIVYMYDGINKDEAEWISFTTGAVIRPYKII